MMDKWHELKEQKIFLFFFYCDVKVPFSAALMAAFVLDERRQLRRFDGLENAQGFF